MTEPRRDQWGRHLLPDPETGEERAWTRATTLAKALDDTYNLNQWRGRMIAKGVSIRDDLRLLARATDLEDKKTLNRVAWDAVDAAGGGQSANVGTGLHKLTAKLDAGLEVDAPYPWDADLRVYREVMQAHGVVVIPDLIEQTVVETELGLAGTFDRIVTFALEWYVADLKTSADLSFSWPTIAIQLAIYARARHLWNPAEQVYEPTPRVNHERALVIQLPEGRAECSLWWVNIAAGWEAAHLAVDVREWQKRKDLAYPIGVDMLSQPALQLAPQVSEHPSDGSSPGQGTSNGETPRSVDVTEVSPSEVT